MPYFISSQKNTYPMLQYNQEGSVDDLLFQTGARIGSLGGTLEYRAKKRYAHALAKFDIIDTIAGPDLVSARFRRMIESIAPKTVEFFEARIVFDGGEIEGFSAVNVLNVEACCDMEKSEYNTCNFDPYNPKYDFMYAVLADRIPYDLDIVRCKDMPYIVVSEKIKQRCFDSKFNNIVFCKSIDLTPKDRSECYFVEKERV